MMEKWMWIYLAGAAATLMLAGYVWQKSSKKQRDEWPNDWPLTVGLMWPICLPIFIGSLIATPKEWWK